MKHKYKKYLAEGTLIIFSVLFALFINKLFDDYQTASRKEIALQSIRKELYKNQEILKNWKERHIKIRNRISAILEGKNNGLKEDLKNQPYLNLGILTGNESLIDAILTDTAWESAKSTGIISEFDFETIQQLTNVYSMQEEITQKTIEKILDYYFNSEAHDLENIDKILIQFQLRFWELTGQEELISSLYKEAIEQIEE
ncbi:hypothetical protein RM553_14105 [Zunongwangia sp. F363]|uniref:Uncharacterized protein n=1 Tax=Autumnicola tepida TaxID=3075595 RepID=A0ABU3CC98_9FLAO|nr:hypothetical protein [Zunongwangia sp. F363]MDT0643967.1 hypothetical protein [Zunongwangia sp. F363]